VRLDLLKQAVKKYTNSAVWTSDGVIMVKAGKERPFRVRNEVDLDKVLKKYPPSDTVV
jgi:hypothetical protein